MVVPVSVADSVADHFSNQITIVFSYIRRDFFEAALIVSL